MVNQLHVKLIKVDLKRKDYDLVSFDLIYHLLVDYEYCTWTVSKLKSDFLKLNQVLPEEFSGDFSATFPFWGIRPTDAKLAKHEEFVAKYVAFLDSVSSSTTVEEFLNLEQHDVLRVALDVLKDHRGNNESEVEVWDMLNSCDEDLILTEKQLHSINLCSEPPEDLQIPFLELRRAIDSVANVKVIGNGFDDSHKYKPSPNLDMSHFQSVTSITLENIDFKGVTELGNLSENLRNLTIKAGIQDIQEILIWVTEADIEPVAWTALETLNLSYNSIEIMDESLQLLIQLSTLDLSYNIISSIDNIQGLPYLRELDLSHNNISDTDALHMKMGNITNLSLAHNKIQLLYGFERLFSLEELDLSHNSVEQLNEVNRLSNLPQLENLSLLGNPISKKSAYRPTVLTVFHENNTFRLDREPTTPAERKKLRKALEKTKEVEVKQEEPICVVEILEESYDKAFLEESQECDEQYVTFSELNINETLPSNKRCLTSLASISELDESFDDETLTSSWFRERAPTIVEVEKMVMFDGDNWLANFMDDIDKDHFERPPTPPPKILKISEETLKSLEPAPPKKQRKMPEKTEALTADSSGSCETESSKGSSKATHSSKSNEAIIRQPSVPFHIVPNEVYNIDEKIEDLVNRYSSLSFHELQPNFSVYRDHELYVMALLPSTPDNPHLVEVKPRGGKMTWSLYPTDIESCDLIGDQISIKKFDEETPRVYSQLFLHDTAHLYLLVMKMKDIREPEPPEDLNKLASDRIVLAAVEDVLNEEFYSFPSHCFRYCKADVPLPVVIAITQSEVLVIKIENHDLLHLNQDILAQILTDETCTFSILHREKMSSIRQVLMSYFEHTVRIEFKEDSNPYGSPETTISLVGYNSQEIEMFLETLASRLDTQNIPPSEIIFTEEETDIRLLKRVLRIQDLQKINCVSVRIMETCYFRCLVMTDNFLYLLEEDFVRWPPPCFVRHPPLTPRYSVVQQIRIRFIQGLTLFAEIYRGSYVLSMGYYKNLKTFERGRVDLFISSYENREQIVGHIKRTWEQYYKKEIIVSSMKRYEVEEEISGVGREAALNVAEFTVDNFLNIPLEKIQRFIGEELNDSYNILYLTKSHCLTSDFPDFEHECVVIITQENLHILTSLPPPTPAKLDSTEQADNRVSDHLGLLISRSVVDICQIVCGIMEQLIRFEFSYNEVGLVTFMTRDVQLSRDLQRVVIEALHCHCQADGYESDNVLITKKGRELSIIHLDEDRLDELRYTIAKHTGIHDYNEVQIITYSLLYQVVGDSKQLITLVLTNIFMCLIKEDNVFWPLPQSNKISMPNSVQFRLLEAIPLEDVMCVHYSHVTSCDIVVLYENADFHNRPPSSSAPEQEFYLIEAVEKLGKTATLHTFSYQNRDKLIRTLCQLRDDELPVKKLGA